MASSSSPAPLHQESNPATDAQVHLTAEIVHLLCNLPLGELAAVHPRKPAKQVFQQLLRQVYAAIMARMLKKGSAKDTGRLFPGFDGEIAGCETAQAGAWVECISSVVAYVKASDGEWGAALQQMFEPVIAMRPRWNGDRLALSPSDRRRKRSYGSYYTPDWIVQRVLDWALEPQVRRTSLRKGAAPPVVYDPACGSGRFLVPALDRLPGTAIGVVQGRDIDPLAADLCRASLALQHVAQARRLPEALHVASGDSLLARRMPSGRKRQSVHEPLVVVGNPPFVNAIGRRPGASQTAKYKAHYSLVRGAADLAAYFLAHAAELAGPAGSVGLVLPRALLNSPSAEKLRAELPHALGPELIWAPDVPFAFAGAAVYFCVVVLGPGVRCRFSTDHMAAPDSFRTGQIESSNWWRELCRARYGAGHPAGAAAITIGDVFEVHAGLTASEAYELHEFVEDSADGGGIKLLTTGLIDPDVSLWGQRTCRFLKHDFSHPRVSAAALDNPRLARRIKRARRPKLIVAGLARRLESYLDLHGEYLGSVSTFVITHPRDNLTMLRQLQHELCAPRTAEAVFRELGAHALGGGNTTIKKSFLRQYPLQDATTIWE